MLIYEKSIILQWYNKSIIQRLPKGLRIYILNFFKFLLNYWELIKFLPALCRAEWHDFWSRFLLIHSPFLLPSFFRREGKREKNNQSRGQNSCLSDQSIRFNDLFQIFSLLNDAVAFPSFLTYLFVVFKNHEMIISYFNQKNRSQYDIQHIAPSDKWCLLGPKSHYFQHKLLPISILFVKFGATLNFKSFNDFKLISRLTRERSTHKFW